MRRPSIAVGALAGGLTSVPLMTLLYLGSRLADLPFVPFDLFDWLARVLPGGVITLVIGLMVRTIRALHLGETSSTAKHIEQGLALAQMVGIGLVFGALIAVGMRRWRSWTVGPIAGAGVVVLVCAVELNLGAGDGLGPGAIVWLAAVLVAWGSALAGWLAGLAPRPAQRGTAAAGISRRAAVAALAGGSLGAALVAWGLGRLVTSQAPTETAGQPLRPVTAATTGSPTPPGQRIAATLTAPARPVPTPTASSTATARTTSPPAAAPATAPPAADRPPATPRPLRAPAPGTRPAITPNPQFYRIDIDTRPPRVDGTTWRLAVAGLFAHPRPLGLADLTAFPTVTQPITIGCISNPVGGDLISASNWTGVRLRDVLQALGLRPTAQALEIRGVDGFYESVPLHEMLDPRTLLVYAMNGQPLPMDHGFPLRIYIPNHYGMKQPKWIARIAALEHPGTGFWVDRGWNKQAVPQIQSTIDTVARDQVVDGRVPVGGMAWAGDRGIRKVEVQVDGGAWTAAVLLPPPGPLTWVLWRYEWPRQPGDHTFRVRATDGTGALQIEQPAPPEPNGATGYHTVSVTI